MVSRAPHRILRRLSNARKQEYDVQASRLQKNWAEAQARYLLRSNLRADRHMLETADRVRMQASGSTALPTMMCSPGRVHPMIHL